MAPWGDAKLVFCILFITCCCTATLAQMPSDCCLSIKNKPVDKHVFVNYRQQVSGMGCAIDAMILMGRRGKTLCVPLNEAWVQEVVSHVDRLRRMCRNNNQKKRCHGVGTE